MIGHGIHLNDASCVGTPAFKVVSTWEILGKMEGEREAPERMPQSDPPAPSNTTEGYRKVVMAEMNYWARIVSE